jgi:L-alanine-DL-glutamate epimerase-like enolase superfamily enzyme
MLEVPVYTLLGGKFRDKILIYHDTGSPSTADPKAWVDEAKKSLDWGFKAMKFDLNPWRGDSWNRSLEAADIRDWIKIL